MLVFNRLVDHGAAISANAFATGEFDDQIEQANGGDQDQQRRDEPEMKHHKCLRSIVGSCRCRTLPSMARSLKTYSVAQTFLSAGSGDLPVARIKNSVAMTICCQPE